VKRLCQVNKPSKFILPHYIPGTVEWNRAIRVSQICIIARSTQLILRKDTPVEMPSLQEIRPCLHWSHGLLPMCALQAGGSRLFHKRQKFRRLPCRVGSRSSNGL
jgi:hypothetical protein